MRMAFGLVSVLVAMGAIVLIISNFYAPHTQVVLTEGRKAREEVSQMAGYGQDGLKATETVTLAPELRSDGKVDNLIVTSITVGGALEQFYGLKKDDCIIATSEWEIRGSTDPELAKSMVFDAYAKKRDLIVLRNGEKVKLPLAAAPSAATPGATPSSPSGASSGKSGNDPLQTQLNAIREMP